MNKDTEQDNYHPIIHIANLHLTMSLVNQKCCQVKVLAILFLPIGLFSHDHCQDEERAHKMFSHVDNKLSIQINSIQFNSI